MSTLAGFFITADLRRIGDAGQQELLNSIAAPYAVALREEPTEDLDPPGPGQLILIVGADGETRLSTLGAALNDAVAAQAPDPGVPTTVSVGDDDYRVVSTSVSSSEGTSTITTALATEQQAALLDQVIGAVVLAIIAINVAFAVASWLITTAVLNTVRRLRRGAENLAREGGENLLEVGPARDEIADLAHTMNELIGDLRASAARERQIVADASHELRTPIAILTSQLELAARDGVDAETMRADLIAATQTAERLGSLATSLLVLSRIDAQTVSGSSTIEEVLEEVAAAADRGRTRASGRAVTIDFSDAPLPVTGTVNLAIGDVGRLCDNLVSNALAVVPTSGHIDLQVGVRESVAGTALVLAVDDDGGGMDDDFLPLALQRFSRAPSTGSATGAGLGLSIVAALVDSANGMVSLHNRVGVGLRVEILLPIFPIVPTAVSTDMAQQ